MASYVREEMVEKSSSTHNPHIEVSYAFGRYMLNAENVNLSFGGLDKVFRETFSRIRKQLRGIHSVLLLGVGGGNVPVILRRYGDFQITGVEIDAEILRMGYKYFDLGNHTNLKVVKQDAIDFVAESDDAYDMVVVDLFIDDQVPPGAERPEFLRKIARMLTPGGILLFNRLMLNDRLVAKTNAFTQKMQEVLPGTRYFKAHVNRMLIYEKPS